MKKPVIGITIDLVSGNSAKYSYASLPWYALRRNYCDSVFMAGGIPILLPYHEDMDQILSMIDGLIIPGGDEDINPKFYGQEIRSDKVKVNDIRAQFELELIKKAMEIDIPFLGICNGMQVLNVALGGSLIQHIPDFIKSDINHEQPEPKNVPSHIIKIKEGTVLNSLTKSKEVMVTSTHHQAVDRLGNGLIASAFAPDSIIEAIELPSHKFCVGIEWHCEYLNSELDRNLFKRLVEESKSFR